MSRESFLGAVARAYSETCDDLSQYCFVFPSRRSGTFFLKNLSQQSEGAVRLAPEVMAVGDFMQTVAGMDVAPRITQLMELYLAYRSQRSLDNDLNSEEALLDFDEFLPWGEVVLGDFSEVDMYNVDAEKIFENVRDYRNITADFLTDEQKEIIERYFGYRPEDSDVRGFWMHFDRENDSTVKNKYLELWQRLPELYFELRKRLEEPAKGLPMSLSGSGYRVAMDKVKEYGADALPWKHIVVVGLDWLSTTEAELFSELRKIGDVSGEPIIEFFWDATGPILNDRHNQASKAVNRNRSRSNFPEPEWAQSYMAQARRDSLPELTEIAVPSNAAQTKMAGQKVEELLRENLAKDIEDARVAVVLPDENLLLPLLYSLPINSGAEKSREERGERRVERRVERGESREANGEDDGEVKGLKSVNLTMGWSMKYTSTAAFMYHLQRIHRRRKKIGTEVAYLTSDFRLLTAQPLVQILVGVEALQGINSWLRHRKMRLVPLAAIREHSEVLAEMLKPMDKEVSFSESVAWLERLLLSIDERLSEGDGDVEVIITKVERMQLQVYLTALYQIEDSAMRAGVEMRFNTLFHLFARMTSGQKIQFEGEPLEGLQVMGLMETRALDFDRVIILSMNDKVMPKRVRKRSFIPDALRHGYGMPLTGHDENRYAYWFYRLMSRCLTMDMIYDSRVGEGMRSGGKSRYLMQLEKLYARNEMKRVSANFKLSSTEVKVPPVPKSTSIMERLKDFTKDVNVDGRNLSASALAAYLKCPVQFLYRYVLQYNDRAEDIGYIDAIAQGDIFHDMMLRLYFDENEQRKFLQPGKLLSREWFDRTLADEQRLRQMMVRSVNRAYGKMTDDLDRELIQSSQMVADRLLDQVKGVLRHDRDRAPLMLLGGEVKDKVRRRINDNLEVNMTASFDRVEMTPEGKMRVVDYKTGSVHLKIPQLLENVFNADYDAGNVFQLLVYSNMLENKGERHGMGRGPVEMVIFETNAMQRGNGERFPHVDQYGKTVLKDNHEEAFEKFEERLNQTIEEIFNPEIPFRPTDDEENCRLCVMKTICGK